MYPNTPLQSRCAYIELTSSRLKLTMKECFLTAETSSIHVEWIEEILSSIKIFINCPSHRVAAVISDIGTCAFKRGIRVGICMLVINLCI